MFQNLDSRYAALELLAVVLLSCYGYLINETVVENTAMAKSAVLKLSTSIRQAPVFGTSEHYRKASGSLLSG